MVREGEVDLEYMYLRFQIDEKYLPEEFKKDVNSLTDFFKHCIIWYVTKEKK